MVNYKLQEEDKERRAEAERIMVENQKKIEEQQRKMVSAKFLNHKTFFRVSKNQYECSVHI